MNTTELFDFYFVNRENERNVLKDFMSDANGISLWIRGDRGFGKTEFFHYGINHQNKYELCYFDIKKDKNSVDIISEFIVELQKHCDENFLSSVKNKYKHFYNSTYQKVSKITSEIFPQISSIVSFILDTGNYAVTFSDERKSSIDLINDYITLIIKKKKLCLCIDNFSRCNIDIAQIFLRIIKTFIKENNFKSCIITTTEDLTNELKEEIFHNLPFTGIEIDKLEKSNYFYQILNPIFFMKDFTDKEINYIYNKCNGSPKKLSTVISKLLERNGVIISDLKKAIINKNVLWSILQEDHLKFSETDFRSEQKWVIFSYLCLNVQTPVHYIKELALYISMKSFLYQGYNETKFGEVLLGLIDNRILIYENNNIVSTAHDQDYIELMDIFNNSTLKNLFSQYAYEFLLQNSDYPAKEELICHHAYVANITNWHIINFRYGKKLYKERLFYDAYRIFYCLRDAYNKLSPIKILLLAVTSYETGNYQTAIKQFELICLDKLRFNILKYNYYFYLGKAYNNIGDTQKAVVCLQCALREVDEESREYVQVLNVLHMYCIEIPEKLEDAKTIFKKIKNSYKESFPIEWANTMRGCQNFYDDISALEILDEADAILTDELDKAYLKTTKGFVFVKLNQIQEGEEQFREASKTIKKLKIHEYSYAANNLAVCFMIKKNYKTAREILLEASFWNRTNYGELVLNTHLMICALYLKDKSNCKYYYNFLKDYMEVNNVVDPIVNRKVYMNLAIASSYLENHIMENAFYQKAKLYISKSSSEWRYYMLTNQIKEVNISKPAAQYQQILDFDPWFLIYAHD